MIRKSKKSIEFVNAGKNPIAIIYSGIVKVWEAISGCFTKGYWINNRKRTNDKGWKNN